MTFHDLVIVLVMMFPMFIFTVFAGIKASEFLEIRYGISESQKRFVMLGVTFLFSFALSLGIHYI